MVLSRWVTLGLVLLLSAMLLGATGSIQTITSRPSDVDCSQAGTDQTVWLNTTTLQVKICQGGVATVISGGTAPSGSAIILDLGNNGSQESTGLLSIATTGDINSIFSEPTPDHLLVNMTLAWPKADALTGNGANCAPGLFPLGVSATGAAENCTPLPTTITGTTNQINVSASTGPVVISLPNNPVLPGTTSGTFAGPLTGNVTGNVTGSAGTAGSLTTNGGNCAPGSAARGVDAFGVAEDCFDVATEIELQAHLTDPTAAHAASAISFAPNGSIAASNIQAALQEVRDEAPRKGGPSDCAEAEIYKTASGLWQCATDASGTGGAGTPGGASGQIQINIAGAFAGDPDLTWDSGLNRLSSTGGFVGPLIGSVTGNVTGNLTGTASDLSCAGCVTIGELTFDPATQAELDAHTGATTAHGSTSANTPNTIVQRNASGNFSAGTITAALAGNAATASALAADGGNCSPGSFPLGVDTAGVAQNCTPLPTSITGTPNQIAVSATTGVINVSIPANPVLPGTTSGTFAGSLSGNASTATSLAADGGNCSPGNAPLGVDTLGAAQGCFAVTLFNDDRLAAMNTPVPLSTSSQILCNKPTIYVEGSTLPVNLSSPAWIQPGTFPGQECRICGSHPTNTVTGPNSTGVRLEGNTGSVSVGANTSCVDFVWLGPGTHWRQIGVPSAQQTITKNRLIGGLTAAAPLQLRGGTADAPSTTGFDLFDDGSGNPVLRGISAGGVADIRHNIPAGKSLIVLGNAIEFERITVAGVHTYSGAGRPRKSVSIPAAAFETDQVVCSDPARGTVNGHPKQLIACTDPASDTPALYADVLMPDAWDAGPITIQTDWLSPSNLSGQHVDTDWNGFCVSDNDTVPAHTTTGVQTAITTFGNQTQDEQLVVTSPITLNNTCAPGDHLYLRGRILAATNATMANVRFLGIKLEYVVTSRSD